MQLSWYFRRLRSMPPGEVCWRVRRLSWQVRARLSHGRWHARYLAHRSKRSDALKSLDSVRFYGLTDITPADVPARWKDRAVEVADRLLQHRFRYLALGEIDLGDSIRWNHEYKRGIDTPLVFGPWMDYRDSEAYGDFKYFWEVPRLQHLILLAKAYFLTDDPRYAGEVLGQLRQFREQAPYLLGVNWTVPMEAGIRLISLSWITMFLRRFLGEHQEGLDLIESMVRADLDYVVHNYARYSSANNHLIGEAAGVFVAAACFAHLKGMRHHRDKAFKILNREIQEQHFPDGVNKEQAVHYQVFALSFFLLAGLMAKANDMDFASSYWDMLDKSVEFIAALTGPKCHLPHLGDSDDGRAVVLSAPSADDAATVLAASAVLFQKGDFKVKAGSFDEASFWLLGRGARDAFDQVNADTSAGGLRRCYPDGGYYILEGGPRCDVQLIFDCGPLGFGSIAAHGHADALSFVLTVAGQEVFVDPGTYTYDHRDPLRDYFRSTAAHNTVVVDGQGQSTMAGPFLWSQKAGAVLESTETSASREQVVGSHDGYRRLVDPLTHRRSIELTKDSGTVTVVDSLEAKSAHRAALHFHVAPDWDVEPLGNNHFRLKNGTRSLELSMDKSLTCETLQGSDSPLSGWSSPAYDVIAPIHTIIGRVAFEGSCRLLTTVEMTAPVTSQDQSQWHAEVQTRE